MPTKNPNGNAKQIMLTLAAFRHMLRAGRPNPAGFVHPSADRPSRERVEGRADLDGRTNN